MDQRVLKTKNVNLDPKFSVQKPYIQKNMTPNYKTNIQNSSKTPFSGLRGLWLR